jgi:hypothetical protein
MVLDGSGGIRSSNAMAQVDNPRMVTVKIKMELRRMSPALRETEADDSLQAILDTRSALLAHELQEALQKAIDNFDTTIADVFDQQIAKLK